ncbi:hypothetical protein E2C01_062286 [Portunus trituberculatus]|uniref:Uncharacterized protein n=1 Tax=Portunus trituberculatus TaxID=210409 RepID=A0A5B7HHL9_PORTR|nr:hypothetical protein [Portunus trituberculatus]
MPCEIFDYPPSSSLPLLLLLFSRLPSFSTTFTSLTLSNYHHSHPRPPSPPLPRRLTLAALARSNRNSDHTKKDLPEASIFSFRSSRVLEAKLPKSRDYVMKVEKGGDVEGRGGSRDGPRSAWEWCGG